MFELPEYVTITRQMNQHIQGKQIKEGRLGNSPHKFVWYNVKHDEFTACTSGKIVGETYTRGRWLFVPVNPEYCLVFGECGGKILYHESISLIPKKYHLLLIFTDNTALSAFTQMWGAMELYQKGEEQKRKYIKDMRLTPADEGFSFEYFKSLIDECMKTEKRSVKGLLTQDQLIPGLGNSIAQDIMFHAKLHPKHPIDDLTNSAKKQLFNAIVETISAAITHGGRNDEYTLLGGRGGYKRLLDKNAAGEPCPACGKKIEKMHHLGGTCYYCPGCQV